MSFSTLGIRVTLAEIGLTPLFISLCADESNAIERLVS